MDARATAGCGVYVVLDVVVEVGARGRRRRCRRCRRRHRRRSSVERRSSRGGRTWK